MSNFEWLNNDSRVFLERGYLSDGETPEQRIKDIADYAEDILDIDGFSDKFYDYMSKGYYSLSSPIWSNFGKDRGFSISCFGSWVDDTIPSILNTASEVGMMSKYGGGTSGYFGNIRPRGSEITDNGVTSGSVHFMKLFEQMTDTISQGCYDDKTEILTENGYELLSNVVSRKDGTKIAQVTDNDEIEFVEPTDYMEFVPEDNELVHFKDSKNIDLLVTKNHNMVFKYRTKRTNKETGKRESVLVPEYRNRLAEDMPLHRDVYLAHSSFAKEGRGLTFKERLLVALQADGSIIKKYPKSLKFRFSKERKKDRLLWILDGLGVEYTYNVDKDNNHNIYVNMGEELPKEFSKWVNLQNVTQQWAYDFIDELSHWDASRRTDKSFIYMSVVEHNVDIVQAIASMVGYKSRKSVDLREREPNKATMYKIYLSEGQLFGGSNVTVETVQYKGKVYCVEVPTHKLVVRRKGHTLVCGNSTRRGRFSPYLPIEHKDIDEFLEIGTEGNPIQNLTHAVTVTDDWLLDMINGDKEKRKTWAKVLTRRTQIGYPYIFFHDNANNNTVDVYKDKGLTINNSNLCKNLHL
ncbi:ribonucleotide-diphosphate reductase alpha subunit [Staphylococcus phage qdsa001]|nr:ribonucleotide-diphosphate reductase alpha subunit [Staphylococcus phage qdsa001]QXV86157.1 ribonucleotide-diphosphate reductase alpha subunit [Staphylococcus phage SAPYZU_15]UGL60756.1 ribonucleotide-diphosphate reductase alpha subunit [Staphylococcus phage vB_SauM-HM01]UVD42558.1 ribonucleotide reductase of class Ia (aerobic), alpha subunit [Staphylococcus phage vB_SauM-V1SA19]WBF47902.1 nucleotide metabolism protein [Staphylococcus phage SSP49]